MVDQTAATRGKRPDQRDGSPSERRHIACPYCEESTFERNRDLEVHMAFEHDRLLL